MAHFVYFITDGEFIKIGISNNIQKRINSIQTGNPKRLELLRSIECTFESHAINLEKLLHRALSEHRVKGEWFAISQEKINQLPLLLYLAESRELAEPQVLREVNRTRQIAFDMFVTLDLLMTDPKFADKDKKIFIQKALAITTSALKRHGKL